MDVVSDEMGSGSGPEGDGPSLTPTERRLFEVLRSQPGHTFGRAELLAAAVPEAVVLERTVDVHIKNLRNKLGARDGAIQSVRGAGYRFVPPAEPSPGPVKGAGAPRGLQTR